MSGRRTILTAMRSRLPAILSVVLAFLLTACSEPPTREMHQAQGAIDAARAAGAGQYAPEELQAAIDSLRQAEEAVAERDYRLALDRALDSRERAQAAAAEAASQKAAVRSEAERLLAAATSSIALAAERLQAAEAARTRTPAVDELRTALASARADVESAGKALAAEDYLGARATLEGIPKRLEEAMQALAAAPAPRPARPAGRNR